MPLDADVLSQRLAGQTGPRFWRGLEELTETEEFREYLRREFPEQADQWTDPVTRRQFLVLMGASLALAGVTGCSTQPAPREHIMPYVRQPEELVPGRPLFFATAFTLAGYATGLLVESHEGRPTKIEGNPGHPASLGATDAITQASVLNLYDPDRSKTVTFLGRPSSWNEALSRLRTQLEKLRENKGSGLRILTEAVCSPTMADQLQQFLQDFPEAKWYQYEPAVSDAAREGSRRAFGSPVSVRNDFKAADVVLALDADFLASGPGSVRYSHDFNVRRRVRTQQTPLAQTKLNRLYVVESMLTCTGAVADHRLPLKPSQIEAFGRALAARLDVAGVPAAGELPDAAKKWLDSLAKDLKNNAGRCVVLVGDGQPASLHALAHALNDKLGNAGKTVTYADPVEVHPADRGAGLRELVQDMAGRRVEALIIFGVNPVFTAPVDLEFEKHLAHVPYSLHLGLHLDETAARCQWHVPESHYLETWGDARAYDGTVTIVQPLINPLYNSRSAIEMLAAFTEQPDRLGHDIVRDYWRQHHQQAGGSGSFEHFWQKALQDGVVPETALPAKKVTLRPDWAKEEGGGATKGGNLEIAFRPDPTLFDGRFANNGWLQELPKPLSHLTWDNAALLSPATARKVGLNLPPEETIGGRFGWNGGERGQTEVPVVELKYRGRTVRAPAFILPGHADDTITVHLGHGRTRAGRVGNGTGFNAYALRTAQAPWFDGGLEVRKTNERYVLSSTQMHFGMEERAPVRSTNLEDFKKNPRFAKLLTAGKAEEKEVRELMPGPEGAEARVKEEEHPPADRRLVPLTLYPPEGPYPYEGNKWGMAIDLTTCTGCSACVAACQAENNSPVVGKTEVTRGREMHWLRIDRYFQGDPNDALHLQTHFQPVPCMHCEYAPCELVCPVNATVHSHDGLNDMVYNRCVGTRYCSNNCPYKVRRFNFLAYADFATSSLKLQRNPDVTVRSRGVMEKCTYCVQRIRRAEIEAEKDRRPIADHEVLTACQAVCPARAITFGNLNDKKSEVYQWKEEPTNYGLLEGLNTLPRTTYLAAVRNPNPEMG
jgi:molybdopterin-containing oxidoreductase family iron-sulfur binding subunit